MVGGNAVITLSRFIPFAAEKFFHPVTGNVMLKFMGNNLSLQYSLHGVDTRCTQRSASANESCGLHIYTAKTCSNDTEDSGPLFDHSSTTTDPWLPGFYKSDNMGNANGVANVNFGASYNLVWGHAFLIHGQDGSPLACALIPDGTQQRRPRRTVT